jgi:isopentenyl-diphosphate delta-isomerase
LKEGIKKRMIEEMGFSTDVEELFSFIYKSDYENGMIEHEYDYVFISFYDNLPKPNPEEVMDYK